MPSQTDSKRWYQTLLTPQTVFYLLGGVVAVVIFWVRTKESWDKVKALEVRVDSKADVSDLKTVSYKVNKQYQTAREVTERVVSAEKWIEYHKGFEDARKQYNIKP